MQEAGLERIQSCLKYFSYGVRIPLIWMQVSRRPASRPDTAFKGLAKLEGTEKFFVGDPTAIPAPRREAQRTFEGLGMLRTGVLT